MLVVNEREIPYRKGLLAADLAPEIKPDADLFIVNGYPVAPSTQLNDGDRCFLIRKGEVPPENEMNHLLYARHTPGVQDRVRNARVGIMGLGGLGSLVAIALARMGVGRLIVADYDVVEPSNLNRQQYFIDQIGMKKTEAMKINLERINPYVEVDVIDELLTEESIPRHFRDVHALAECFDVAAMKAAALRTVLSEMTGIGYVGASGLAGCGASNTITTRKLQDNIYLVGDGVTAAQQGQGLMAPRVGIAAHHQANKILQLLLERTENA